VLLSIGVRHVRFSWAEIGTIAGVERGVHDRGGWPTDAPIDRTEHELADWELLTDSLVGALNARGLMNVDELRRGIESMPPREYERAGYYERWLFSIETILEEKGVLAPGELERKVSA
jgi:nitrile hydratase subunit beta